MCALSRRAARARPFLPPAGRGELERGVVNEIALFVHLLSHHVIIHRYRFPNGCLVLIHQRYLHQARLLATIWQARVALVLRC